MVFAILRGALVIGAIFYLSPMRIPSGSAPAAPPPAADELHRFPGSSSLEGARRAGQLWEVLPEAARAQLAREAIRSILPRSEGRTRSGEEQGEAEALRHDRRRGSP